MAANTSYSEGGVDEIPALIRWPAIIPHTADGRLYEAILMGRPSVVRESIRKGACANFRSDDGHTALFIAVFTGKKRIVSALIKHGANPNGRCLPDGYTAVHGACYLGSVDILKILIQGGGDLRLTDVKRRKPVDWIEYQPSVLKRKVTRDFIEALRYCVMQNDLISMKEELRMRIDATNVPLKLLKFITGCSLEPRFSNLSDPTSMSTGFGKIYFSGKSKCCEITSVPCINEIDDLQFEKDSKAPSWICGRFTTFIAMQWVTRKTSVAMKTLRQKSVEEAVPDLLIYELSILCKLQHPHILMLMAICQQENFNSLSLVFEKVFWGSLYYFLHQQSHRMKSSFATDVVIQIAEALDYIHGSGFLHCGISSHAIMLVNENNAKISCFEYAIPQDENLSKVSSLTRHPWQHSETHLSVIKNWMAPEVLSDSHEFSPASDIYSLCAVIWELIVGEVPWKDLTFNELKSQFKENPQLHLPVRKDIVPPLWASVLHVGLRTSVDSRDLDLQELVNMMMLIKNSELSSRTSVRASDNSTPKESWQRKSKWCQQYHKYYDDDERKSGTGCKNSSSSLTKGSGHGKDFTGQDKLDGKPSQQVLPHLSDNSSGKSFKSFAYIEV